MIMKPLSWVKLSDDLLEYSAAFAAEDGTVTITVAQYMRLMVDAGWKERKSNG